MVLSDSSFRQAIRMKGKDDTKKLEIISGVRAPFELFFAIPIFLRSVWSNYRCQVGHCQSL